jgi:saccharopine dehydrogenase (NAD+, L-lysine-forming)
VRIGLIREGKLPPDARVAFTPRQCREIMDVRSDLEIVVQSSDVRCFYDLDYRNRQVEVRSEVSDCDLLFGIKEIPLEELVAEKTYWFFTHTAKRQSYNRELLRRLLELRIRAIDYEYITDPEGKRLIAFGRFAGLVGAYNALLGWGERTGNFHLKPAHRCEDLEELKEQLAGFHTGEVRIVVTGGGRVAGGVREVLESAGVRALDPEAFLRGEGDGGVYTRLRSGDYHRARDGAPFIPADFYTHPERFESTFEPYTRCSDILIAGAYWDLRAPVLFTPEQMCADEFRIRLIADITCDIEGSIPSTKQPSTIAEPFYDYVPATGALAEAFHDPGNVTVMAVDHLPNELPRDASRAFGRHLIERVFPHLFGGDPEGIIARATICRDGALTPPFAYLQDFADAAEE